VTIGRSDGGARRAVTMLQSRGLVAAVDDSAALSLLAADGSVTRIYGMPRPAAAEGPPIWDLVAETAGRRAVLASGPHARVEVFRTLLADGVAGKPRRGGGWLLARLSAAAVAGFLAGGAGALVLLTQPEPPPAASAQPAIPPGMALPPGFGPPPGFGQPTPPGQPAPAAEAPAPRAALPDPAQAAVAARALTRGAAVHPEVPVSLDEPLASIPGFSPPPATPASADDAIVPPSQAPAAPVSPPARPEAALQEPRTATPAATTAASDAARKTIAAITSATEDLRRGMPIDTTTMAALPPEVAARIAAIPGTVAGNGQRQSQAAASPPQVPGESVPQSVVTKSGAADPYGIPAIPGRMGWAAIGTPSVPLPGGGDIKTPADMAAFGFDPGQKQP